MYIYDKVDSLPLSLSLKKRKSGEGGLFIIYNVRVMEETPPFFSFSFIYVINKVFSIHRNLTHVTSK